MEMPQWGRSNRRMERQTARELAKQILQGARKGGTLKTSLGGLVVAILTLLLSPKLNADLVGHVITAFLLIILWGIICYLILGLPWVRDSFARKMIAIVASAIPVVLFGMWVWPNALQVSPPLASFDNSKATPVETNIFRITNRSDDDLYNAEIDFIADDPASMVRDFWVDIAPDSRKSFGQGAGEHIADVIGFMCRDYPQHRPLFILSFQRLVPNEMRNINVSYRGTKGIKVLAKVGAFSTDETPISTSEHSIGRYFHKFSVRVDDSVPCTTFFVPI
jgi:hypothetical protein